MPAPQNLSCCKISLKGHFRKCIRVSFHTQFQALFILCLQFNRLKEVLEWHMFMWIKCYLCGIYWWLIPWDWVLHFTREISVCWATSIISFGKVCRCISCRRMEIWWMLASLGWRAKWVILCSCLNMGRWMRRIPDCDSMGCCPPSSHSNLHSTHAYLSPTMCKVCIV